MAKAKYTDEQVAAALAGLGLEGVDGLSIEDVEKAVLETKKNLIPFNEAGKERRDADIRAAAEIVKDWLRHKKRYSTDLWDVYLKRREQPDEPGKIDEPGGKTARQKAIEEGAARRAKERAERGGEADAGGVGQETSADAGEEEKQREPADAYANVSLEDYYMQPALLGLQGVIRRRRRRELIKLWLMMGVPAVVALGLYVGLSSDWGSHWPYIGERPQQIIVCWDKITLPYEFAVKKLNERITGKSLWHGIWWGGHPVIHVTGKKWVRPKKQVIIETSLDFFNSREEMFGRADCYKSWRQIQVVEIDEIRKNLAKSNK